MTRKKKIVRTLIIIAVILLLLSAIIFQNSLVRLYVRIFHGPLEDFAVELLTEDPPRYSPRYGPWDARCLVERGMVEFSTGGYGLVPSTTYFGFYYSADDVHIPFQGADYPMVVDGDVATWTDGTDNHGTSTRIMENWFWFEASF